MVQTLLAKKKWLYNEVSKKKLLFNSKMYLLLDYVI